MRIVFGVLAYSGLLFGSAGTLAWPEAWIFLVSLFVGVFAGGLWLKRHDPALFAERTKPLFQKGQPVWDRVILVLFASAWLGWFVVPGLDAVRYGWSHVPFAVQIMGGVLYLFGFAGIMWTMKANTFLAPVVRILSERGHQVVDTGPYAIVRHPMYVSVFLWMPGASLLLGSWWGTLFCAVPIGLLTVRTALEDRMLQRDLAGYADYARRVRYRLVPGVW